MKSRSAPKLYSPRPVVKRQPVINKNNNIKSIKLPVLNSLTPIISTPNNKLYNLSIQIYEREYNQDGKNFAKAFKVFTTKHPNLTEAKYIEMINYFMDFLDLKYSKSSINFEIAIIEFSILGAELLSQCNLKFEDLYKLHFQN